MKKVFISTVFIATSLLYANGENIYTTKCASCHGSHGEKAALDRSKSIAGQNTSLTIKQIQAYQNGSLNQYGMGGAMKNMVKSLNENEIKEVAHYISKLK
ncbi:MAG: c-type cytochrome [Sulfurovaceae bacterium]|nr:c-type cytochrome [Sulfurovaceae bacterium]MDD5547973.1 c-type cytochrome [Sulfurovaceae bacterium]